MLMAKGTLSSLPPPKGRPPLRGCPDDFCVIFVEQGRVGCEAWYRARRDTVTRWMVEQGKDKLIKARAAFVAHQRANGNWMTRQTPLVSHHEVRRPSIRESIRDRRKVNPVLARHAAQHLRIMRNGGMIVSPVGDGEWWVGSKRLSSAQLVDLAKSKGFVGTAATSSPANEAIDKTAPAKFNSELVSADKTKDWADDWRARWLHENGNADYSVGAAWQTGDDDPAEDVRRLTGRKVKP
jgi:hypothetical protein